MSQSSKVFFVSTHRYGWHSGKPLEIIGVATIAMEGKPPRVCFHLRDPEDNSEDYAPIFEDRQFYELITAEDVTAGRIPEVVH